MIKKTFYLILLINTFFALSSIMLYIYIYSKEKQLIIQTTNNFQYNMLINSKNNELKLIKKIIANEYNYSLHQIKTKKNLNLIAQNIISNIKYIPNVIIYYKGKKIKGNFSQDSFYIFEEFKPLKIFFGIGIKYNKIDDLTEKLTNEIDRIIKPIMYKIIIIFISLLLIFYIFYFTFIKKIFKKIEKILYNFEKEAKYDYLTGIYTRKFFEKVATSTNYKNLIIVDLDNFKYVNDTFGHDIGDLVLKKLGYNLKQYFKNEPIGRWGGDEFLILSDKSKNEIIKIFKELNSKIHSLQQSFDSSMNKKLSLSVGVCANKNLTFEEKFKKADLALYKVKKNKKGNILFYSDIDYIKMEKDDLK